MQQTRLVEIALGTIAFLIVVGAYTHSREVSARADSEHQANLVLQDQLKKMRLDLEQQAAIKDAQYKKDTESLQHRFDVASKDRAKMAALLSQLAKLPVPVQVTTPPPTKENPKPAPEVVVPKEDFQAMTDYERECEQCKLDRGKFEYDAAEAQKELADLGMAGARLDAVLEQIPLGDDPVHAEVPAWGADQLELTLAANPGEPARPLRKVASGGELSRTMLALKTVLAAHDRLATLVFDEIDANVGGRLGDVLGQKLAALGQTHQVICVTHLPQVASYAPHHWTIRKSRRGKRTVTQIHPLRDEDRLEELASMLRGEARGETTRREAAAMLDAARRCW